MGLCLAIILYGYTVYFFKSLVCARLATLNNFIVRVWYWQEIEKSFSING